MTIDVHDVSLWSANAEAHALLNAMEGVVYLTRPDGTILAVGERNWSAQAASHHVSELDPRSVVGSNLFGKTRDSEVRQVQEHLHREIVSGRREAITYTYRCDAPEAERLMRMSMTPLLQGDAVAAVLYQSVILDEKLRPPMPLFEKHEICGEAAPAPEIVRLCSYCHDVAWPTGAGTGAVEWIKPEEYYRRGGSTYVMVSHGICPDCFARLMEQPHRVAPKRKGHRPRAVPGMKHHGKQASDNLGATAHAH